MVTQMQYKPVNISPTPTYSVFLCCLFTHIFFTVIMGRSSFSAVVSALCVSSFCHLFCWYHCVCVCVFSKSFYFVYRVSLMVLIYKPPENSFLSGVSVSSNPINHLKR